MKVEAIEKLLAAETGKMKGLCKDIPPVFAPEPIHKFRVEVKRLRAFMRLLASQHNEPGVQLPKKFKALYDIAGHIREAQLEEKILTQWGIDAPQYYTRLETEIIHYKQQWEAQDIMHIVKELEREVLDHDYSELQADTLLDFITKHVQELRHTINHDPDNEHIHECRKQVKDMLYNIKLLDKEWKHASDILATFPLQQLEDLADKLGSYNDERIILERLTTYLPEASKEESTHLQTICEELRLSQFVAKKRILAATEYMLDAITRWRKTR